MKSRFCLLLCFLTLVAMQTKFAAAEEPYLEFLQGLRDRGYYDYALLYLDQLSQRPTLPPQMKPMILFERAMTLREYSKALRSPEKQSEQLDQALAFLEQFVADYPDHPSAGDANYERAQILLQKATVEINQAKSPANKGSKLEFQQRGRELVRKAREVVKLAHDQHETALKAFPSFIDEQKEPKLKAERDRVDRALINEAMDLARCTYQEAQTYDPSSRDFKQLLAEAADDFEKVYVAHRKQLGGQLALAWKGKCYEEQGQLDQALGIYNEIMDQPEDDASFQNLKSQTLLFKLNCMLQQGESLQGEAQKDQYTQVASQADEWLKQNSADSKTAIGLGIQWNQARAYEALGDNRNLPKPDQARYWRQARVAAQNVSKFTSEYKDFATVMAQRLQTKLGSKERKLEDFESALSEASMLFERSKEAKKELDAAMKAQRPPDDITRIKQDWSDQLNEASRNFELAATLVTRKDNPTLVSSARYLQAQTYFYLAKYYEAAILSDYVARKTADDDTGMALDAAYISMLAFQNAYQENKAEPDKKKDDLKFVIKAANYITERWPESEKANEARMKLGRIYAGIKQPSDAAEWYSKVPESDSKYAEAQMLAGQAFWDAYQSSARQAPEFRPSPEKLAEWKGISEKHLRTGIEKLSAGLPKEGAVPQELVSAKIYLAEILLSQGKAADAAKVLLDDPQSIVKAVAVPNEAQRPAAGIQSRGWAMSVYRLLLRAYISMGTDKLDSARETMKTLETIAAADPNSDLTDLYVGLGRSLKSELEQFRANGETERFNKQMEAFELFLNDMFKKQDGQTFGPLSWIGETYMTLGEISTDRSKSTNFYDRAATALNRIVSRTQNEASFATPDQLLGVKTRLVHCNRLKKDFEGAEQMLNEVLKARGNDLKTQIEGAMVYQDWGSNVDHNKLVIAINGRKDTGLWGWGGIAKRLQQQKNFVERPDLIDTFLDARYNVSLCRFRYVKELSQKDKQKGLDNCAKELVGSASIFRTIPDEKRAKLNELFRDVLREAGKPVTDMPRFEDAQPEPPVVKEQPKDESAPEEVSEKAADKKTDSDASKPAAETKPAEKSDMMTWVFLCLALLGGAGIVTRAVLNAKQPKVKQKNMTVRTPVAPAGFTGIAFEKEKEKEKSLPTSILTQASGSGAPKPRPKSTAAPGSATPGSASSSGQRPASRPASKSDGSAAPQAKPRPKPPAPPPPQ